MDLHSLIALATRSLTLRVLELGAGISLAIAGIVKYLTRPNGQVLFS